MVVIIKDMDEEIFRRKYIKVVLVNKFEGCSDIVNMVVIILYEDVVISVFDDKWVENFEWFDVLEVLYYIVLVEFLII